MSRAAKAFTPKQGQYLAFIHPYTRLHRRPPAETDMQEYFRVSPPSVHQMVLTLERAGFIRRQPRVARSIEMLVDPKSPAGATLIPDSTRQNYRAEVLVPSAGDFVRVRIELMGGGVNSFSGAAFVTAPRGRRRSRR